MPTALLCTYSRLVYLSVSDFVVCSRRLAWDVWVELLSGWGRLSPLSHAVKVL